LPDPDAGLRALRNVLKPDGAMQLMVYATYGRAGIYMLREFCRRVGIQATDEGIREVIVALAIAGMVNMAMVMMASTFFNRGRMSRQSPR
jgi:hypothetical protein